MAVLCLVAILLMTVTTDSAGAVSAAIISSLQGDPACIGEIAVLTCKITGSALIWRWNQETIRTYNTEHKDCQRSEPSEYTITGADINTTLAVVDYDANGSITGCTSILEINATMDFNDNISCIANLGGLNSKATVLYTSKGSRTPNLTSVEIREEILNFKALYSISWESSDDVNNVDYYEVKVNTGTSSMRTFVHPMTTSIEVILTNQVASSVEVSVTDKCQKRFVITQQRDNFERVLNAGFIRDICGSSSNPCIVSESIGHFSVNITSSVLDGNIAVIFENSIQDVVFNGSSADIPISNDNVFMAPRILELHLKNVDTNRIDQHFHINVIDDDGFFAQVGLALNADCRKWKSKNLSIEPVKEEIMKVLSESIQTNSIICAEDSAAVYHFTILLSNTTSSSARRLQIKLQSWVMEEREIQLEDDSTIKIDSSCHTEISPSNISICTPLAKACSSCSSSCWVVSVALGVLLLLAVAVIISILIPLIQQLRKSKGNFENDIPENSGKFENDMPGNSGKCENDIPGNSGKCGENEVDHTNPDQVTHEIGEDYGNHSPLTSLVKNTNTSNKNSLKKSKSSGDIKKNCVCSV